MTAICHRAWRSHPGALGDRRLHRRRGL